VFCSSLLLESSSPSFFYFHLQNQRFEEPEKGEEKMERMSNEFGFRRLVESAVGLDYRSLAVWRLCLALVTLGDLWDRLRNLHEHYTEEGIWPVQNYFMGGGGERYFLVLHAMNDHFWFQNLLGCLHFLCCLFMFFGWKTRLSSFFVWFLTT
jgi:hypothetical protein